MTKSLRFPLEFFLLAGLFITVPLLEAPKNILWVLYLATWTINRYRARDFGGAWDGWDTLIALWIASGYLIAPFAGLPNSEWGGANDILRYGSIFWTIKRSGYDQATLHKLLWLVIVSTLIALAYGLWMLYGAHTRKALELKSVGHVNHSAIYLAITFGAALSLLLAYWKKYSTWMRLAVSAVALVLAISLFISASRAATGATFALALVLGLAWLKRSRLPLLLLLAASATLGTVAYIKQVEVVQKQERNVQAGIVLSYRDVIWNTALEAWKKYPWFGVGMHNYNQISMDKVEQWVKESGRPYDAAKYGGTSHGHSLYFNNLAERGIVGFGVLLAVLAAWLYSLLRRFPKREADELEWALWGASLSAWVVTVGIGLVNTTLHHEHAILAVSLLGFWLSFLRQKNA